MPKIIALVFLAMLTLGSTSQQKQIFIEYGVGGQGRELLKYFYDVFDGFYIDIGAYDPIFASNTLNLYSQGWGGINVDASFQRLSRFYSMRPDQTNLNYAVGQQDIYLTLYELDEDSSSTVSPKVKQYVKAYKAVVKQQKVPSLTMKQLCQRFYYRKPTFLNLDIQGFGSRALQSNDWSNSKCVPQVIFSQINQQTVQSGLQLPQSILIKHGYKKIQGNVGLNQIYIHQDVYNNYIQKLRKSNKYIENLEYVNLQSVGTSLCTYLKIPYGFDKHYDPIHSSVFYKFVKNRETIFISQLYKNAKIGQKADRPIIILHYNINKNALVLEQGSYTKQTKQITSFRFCIVNVTQTDNTKYTLYILDHNFPGQFDPKITILSNAIQFPMNKTYTPPRSILQQSTSPQQKLTIEKIIGSLSGEIKKQQAKLQEVNNRYEQTSKQARTTFVTYHNIELSILQQIEGKFTMLQKRIQQQIQSNNKQLAQRQGNIMKPVNSNSESKINKQLPQNMTNTTNVHAPVVPAQSSQTNLTARGRPPLTAHEKLIQQLKNLQIIIVIILLLIGIMTISLCMSICVLNRSKHKNSRKGTKNSAVRSRRKKQEEISNSSSVIQS